MVIAASNTFNQKNINMTNDKVLSVCEELITLAKDQNIIAVPYIATSWECPFEGIIDQDYVLTLAAKLKEMGAARIVFADTIGAATPKQVKALCDEAVKVLPVDNVACHFHDTRGFATANIYAAVEAGVRRFDSSIGGLGGCPFAPGATGNVATEDAVVLLEQMGFDTGVNLGKLLSAVEFTQRLTGNCEGGHALRWLKRQREKGIFE